MKTLYIKELRIFFSTIIGPLILGLFMLINSLVLWSDISDFNILKNGYASMDIFFLVSPLIFLLFIPAVSMRVFSEEYSTGTIETLITKPISIWDIVSAKFLAIFTLVTISIVLTLVYVLTIYLIGENNGSLDLAGIIGSYIGLLMLASIFTSISVFSSSLTPNQITAFIVAITISATFYFGFDLLSNIRLLQSIDLILQKIGISYHYEIMSKGLILGSDIIYFISITILFAKFTEYIIKNKNS